MNLRTVLAAATTAAVLATVGVTVAGASDSPTTPSAPAPVVAAQPGPRAAAAHVRHHRRPKLRRLIRAARRIVTDTIGIDRPTLRHELRAGKTIAEIATAHGVTPQAVVDALVTAATNRLEAAAQAGRITTDRAHSVEAKLPARITRFVENWHPRCARPDTD